jgi:probable F420-dependent oxidoreductase
MKLGVNLPQTSDFDLAHDVTAFAREAERIGYDSLWAYERLLSPADQSGHHGLYGMPDAPWPERYGYVSDPQVVLAMAAAVTERAELGTGVLVPPLHVPVRLAKSLAALDAGSGGRLIAGLGSGWSADEFAAVAPRPMAERGAALDEFLDVAEQVWGADPVAFGNERWRIAPARINPKPVRKIPVYLAGYGPAALRRIARRGDGWLPTGLPPERIGAMLAGLRADAVAAGRPADAVGCICQVSYQGLAEVPAAGRAPYTGSIPQLVEDIVALAAAGVDHVYVTLPTAVRNLGELIDAAGTLHAAVRDAGF